MKPVSDMSIPSSKHTLADDNGMLDVELDEMLIDVSDGMHA